MSDIPKSTTPPSLQLRKSVCWMLLFADAGTMIFFLLIILGGEAITLTFKMSLLLFLTVLTAVVSGLVLKRSYRLEPANFSGFWHLSLADLLTATFFTALLMTAFRAIWPDSFVPVGVVVTIALGLGFTFCMLLAARKGCLAIRLKIVCALGYFLSTLGFMTVGMFFFVISFMSIIDGSMHESLREIRKLLNVFVEPRYSGSTEFYSIIRAGIPCILIGYCLRKWADATLAEQRAGDILPPAS